jgi:glycerophosphoryl diester phosphodiesterase
MKTKQEDPSHPRMPQAIAHRGYKAKFPENTLAAFAGAIEIGAHAVETDVHITKDGVVVLSHDNTLNRCFGRPEKIIDCDWSFIAPLLTTEEPKQHMPRLSDLLAFLATEERKDIWVLLDIKLDNNPEDIIRLIASTIAASPCLPSSPWSSRIVLGCWAAKYIPLCAEYLPNVSFNMLLPMLMAPGGKHFLASAKKAQKPVLAWTVNETRKMKWCIRKQLDGVITDDPKLFLEVCRNFDPLREKEQGLSFRTWLDVLRIWVLATIFGFLYRNRFAGRTKSQVQVV